MVKVNLLPSYYFEARKTRTALIVLTVVLVGLAAGVTYWVTTTKDQLASVEQAITAVQPKADLNSKLTSQAQSISGEIAPIVTKTTYIRGILENNLKYPGLFTETARYTLPSIAYTSLAPAQTILNISGYAKRVSDIGRFLLAANAAKHLFAIATVTQGIPGWPPPEAGGSEGSVMASAPTTPGGYGPASVPGGYGPSPGGGAYTPGPDTSGGAGGSTAPGPVAFSVGSSVDLGGGFRFVPVSAKPQPVTLPFTMVAQLQPAFYLMPPTSPYVAATDMSGGAVPGGYPGAGPVPGAGPGGAPPSNGASMGPTPGNSAKIGEE